MKSFSARLYFLLALVSVSLLTWRLIEQKIILRSPEHKLVALLPAESPSWESSDSMTLVDSKKLLTEKLFSQSYLVMDIESRTVLLEKNLNAVLPPASTTKLMTALVALELYNLDEVVTISSETIQKIDGGKLLPGERLSVRSLLIATLVSSANDAAYGLAAHHSEGQKGFIREMNKFAQRWGLTETHFENSTGYDDPPNVSTARDLSVLTIQAIKQPIIKEWMGFSAYEIHNVTNTTRHFLYNTHDLLGFDSRVIAGKTGTTALAREVLVTIAEINGREYLVIILNTEDRYGDTLNILNWLENNIVWR